MTSKNTKNDIQEMEEGESDFGIWSALRSFHKKFLTNEFITEFDLFSIPVRLNFNGNESYQTFFGGLMHLILIVICLLLTYFVIYPNGIEFNSEITQTKIAKDYGDTGQTLFDHTEEPINMRGYYTGGGNITEVSIAGFAEIHVYQVYSDGRYYELELSNDCKRGSQFCIKNTDRNKNAKIYGRPLNEGEIYTYLQYEILWCELSNTSCPFMFDYYVEMEFSNFYKEKGGSLSQYRVKTNLNFGGYQYLYDVTRQVYTSNKKLMGHMSNVFSFDMESYKFSEFPLRTPFNTTPMLTPDYIGRGYVKALKMPVGDTLLIKENFDDFGETILFFLSVKQTFYFVIFFLFVKQYNRNSGYLQIGDSLFYIDDPKTKRKYNFKKGYEVFLACMIHKHFIARICDFFLTKTGRTIHDYLPKKSICAISLINKAEELLQENVFYRNLNDLSMMESEPSKKIPLATRIIPEEQEQDEMSYFPFTAEDTEQSRKEKELKRESFAQFCQANDYVSSSRKNHVYRVLTDRKLKYILAHEMQKEFKSFVQNVRIQLQENPYKDEQIDQDGSSQIKVEALENTSQMISGQNFLKRRIKSDQQ